MKISALITCHNRKAKTLACLDALFRNILPEGYFLDVFLVDDGSTDGTERAVREHYPQANIFKGDGSLYWNGGMRVAFAAAMESGSDYYLWLNDDMMLYPKTLKSLITVANELRAKLGKDTIVVGSAQDAVDGWLTYGGVSRPSKLQLTTFRLIKPIETSVECETMNGNCVLISSAVAKVIGNIDKGFVHAMGDLDYGLRARYAGFSVWVMPGFAGSCANNFVTGSFNDSSLPVTVRLRKMLQPKVLPLSSWRVFTHRHAGALWPIYWLWPYAKVIMKGLVKK